MQKKTRSGTAPVQNYDNHHHHHHMYTYSLSVSLSCALCACLISFCPPQCVSSNIYPTCQQIYLFASSQLFAFSAFCISCVSNLFSTNFIGKQITLPRAKRHKLSLQLTSCTSSSFSDSSTFIYFHRHHPHKTKNRLMVTIHSKDVTKILALCRRSETDFPPHFLDRLIHSFPMMYNTI